MRTRTSYFKSRDEEQNFWPSFVDVMTNIALIMFFLMLLVYIQNLITGNKLTTARSRLEEADKNLAQLQIEIDNAQEELSLIKDEMEKANTELALSKQKIEEQQRIIARSNQELENMRVQLEGIALLRVEILEKVKASIEDELGKTDSQGQPLVTIGENANIVINENLMFAYNSYEIKSEGKALLKELASAFENILDNSDIRENIDAIIIEGHTDDVGSSAFNRDLSTKRATAVVNYLMAVNPKLEQKYGRYFAATGYSEFRPIAEGTSKEARQQNRRIEISIAIKDSNVRNVIDKYLEETKELLSPSY